MYQEDQVVLISNINFCLSFGDLTTIEQVLEARSRLLAAYLEYFRNYFKQNDSELVHPALFDSYVRLSFALLQKSKAPWYKMTERIQKLSKFISELDYFQTTELLMFEANFYYSIKKLKESPSQTNSFDIFVKDFLPKRDISSRFVE
ncbi:hypothetical protein RF11_10533 [Thelohanellus kitauei]|uniref:Uncharacterized protein n=1 Tax=Thelohanellus kitauei TaxID=669202 RepID=A0A0C2M8P2_THEKT|nr:hypothetical protein RF11_10533 [Thelohanellus kitauei]